MRIETGFKNLFKGLPSPFVNNFPITLHPAVFLSKLLQDKGILLFLVPLINFFIEEMIAYFL